MKAADKCISELAQQDPELKRLFERVTYVVGISQTTAAEIILATNEFQDITDPKKFAASAVRLLRGCGSLRSDTVRRRGPKRRSSGQKKGRPQVSHMANKKVKSLLHLAGRPVPGHVGHTALLSTQSLLSAESERRQDRIAEATKCSC